MIDSEHSVPQAHMRLDFFGRDDDDGAVMAPTMMA